MTHHSPIRSVPKSPRDVFRGARLGGARTIALVALVTVLNGCQADQADPGSSGGGQHPSATPTAMSHSKPSPTRPVAPPHFDYKPRTAQEKEFDASIRPELWHPSEKKYGLPASKVRAETPLVYWGSVAYKGVRVSGGEARVAVKNWAVIPEGVRGKLAGWYGNMAGDPQGSPEFTWSLIDYRTGKPVPAS